MSKTLVLIPAYQPDMVLVSLAQQLIDGNVDVVVVNDGSSPEKEAVFSRVAQTGATVLGYETNHGKGYALKYGLQWAWDNGYTAVVTADADGQHTVPDILNIGEKTIEYKGRLVLGARNKAEMPPKSKAGNTLTCWLFHALKGVKISDTQTGLRGIYLTEESTKRLCSLEGDRYEYETNMLIESPKIFTEIKEVPIQTVYEPGNPTSHFRPIKDGMRIYRLLFRQFPIFALASFMSFLVDYLFFNLCVYKIGTTVVVATVAARVISGVFNFLLNKYMVFKGAGKYYTLWRYALLALTVLAVNCSLIWLLTDVLRIAPWFAKILVELTVYFINFFIQSNMTQKK
ncbi:MAG: GtrA family protein [Oscillospiraceae bacterium]|nr:GtrA family protein [Oscillospiraceae bacterium]